MASRSSIVPKLTGGEENTATTTNLSAPIRLSMALVRVHYLFLAPLIILGIPTRALLNQNILVLFLVVLAGLGGTLLARRQLALFVTAGLLSLLIWGKVAVDLLKGNPPDTAVFLVEFGMVLFFMEANVVVLTFRTSRKELGKKDELSQALEERLRVWLRNQLSHQGRIGIGSIGLSIILLPLAGFTSISSSQLPLTGALLLLAIVAFLFLVTHRREPGKG